MDNRVGLVTRKFEVCHHYKAKSSSGNVSVRATPFIHHCLATVCLELFQIFLMQWSREEYEFFAVGRPTNELRP